MIISNQHIFFLLYLFVLLFMPWLFVCRGGKIWLPPKNQSFFLLAARSFFSLCFAGARQRKNFVVMQHRKPITCPQYYGSAPASFMALKREYESTLNSTRRRDIRQPRPTSSAERYLIRYHASGYHRKRKFFFPANIPIYVNGKPYL